MMARLGVELGARTLRGVRVEGWPKARTRAVEIGWDRENPEEAVQALRQHLGAARRVAVAVDLPLLFAKRVKLPAVSAAQRRDILRLEPERFFAVRAVDVVPAVRADDDLVFAAPEASLAGWVAALERIAPVDLVEPAPVALSRALAHAPLADAVALLDARADGIGLVEFRGGRVTRARRLFGDLDGAAAALTADGSPATVYLSPWSEDRVRALAALLPGVTLQPLPAVSDVAGPFLAAYGAALAIGTQPDFAGTLVSPELGRGIRAASPCAQAVLQKPPHAKTPANSEPASHAIAQSSTSRLGTCQGSQNNGSDVAHSVMTASASISTSMSGLTSRLTATSVLAGRMSRNTSPWARPTRSQSAMSVTYIRVRTTSSSDAPACASARPTLRNACTAWAYASPTPTIVPSGPVAVVPAT